MAESSEKISIKTSIDSPAVIKLEITGIDLGLESDIAIIRDLVDEGDPQPMFLSLPPATQRFASALYDNADVAVVVITRSAVYLMVPELPNQDSEQYAEFKSNLEDCIRLAIAELMDITIELGEPLVSEEWREKHSINS